MRGDQLNCPMFVYNLVMSNPVMQSLGIGPVVWFNNAEDQNADSGEVAWR